MISGFGKWTVKSKKKSKGRDPNTGEDLTIYARRVVAFKPSTVMRNEINSGDRGFAMAEKLDPKEVLSSDELLMSEVIQSEALIHLLDRKGIFGRQEGKSQLKVADS